MQVHSFTARSIQEALEKVRQTLGPDAIILSTESHVPELTKNSRCRTVTVKSCRQEKLSTTSSQSASEHVSDDLISQNINSAARLIKQVHTVDSYIEQLYQQEQQKLENQHQQHLLERQQHPEDFVPEIISKTLLNSGMELRQIRAILQTLPEGLMEKQITAFIERQLKQIVTAGTLDLTSTGLNQTRPLTVVLTGRSGTGKSTLAAKLATQCELREELPVAVIEFTGQNRQQHFWMHLQMQRLGIQTAQVSNSAELHKVLQQFSDCTAVFIDTPAVSNNPQQIALVNAMVQDIVADYCILTHDIHTRPQASVELAKALKPSCQLMMALTKTDEAKSLGHLVSLFQQIPIPVTLLSHSAGLADGFTHVTESVHSKLIYRMTGLDPAMWDTFEEEANLKKAASEIQAQDSFTLNLNPT